MSQGATARLRGLMHDDRLRHFLEAARRRHAVGGRDEGFEKAPAAPGDQARAALG
jgi:hypothetical protein